MKTLHGRFVNSGSLCYMISILHALQYIDIFKKQLYDNPTELSKIILYLFEVVKNDVDRVVGVKILQRILNDTRWQSDEQHDASEFLYSLFDKLDRNSNIFSGWLRRRYKCMKCGNKSYSKEEFKIIDLPVKNSECSIIDLLDEYFSEKYLDADNKYICDLCSLESMASIKTNITTIPKCLIICLKRYSHSFSKLNSLVRYSEKLSLEKYYLSHNPCTLTYKLCAVILHYGHLNGGHYITAINKNGCIYLYDDASEVRVIDNIVSHHAYILFYLLDEK
jgi:ubiquitin C-terminal hydrolase